jgi:nickel/cobalt transporter (NicO) family protein
MPRLLILALVAVAALALWLWTSGGFDQLAAWAAIEQRAFQNQMAQALRAIRNGQPGAVALLLSLCFAYGFFHAVGPGHGKVLIGGYGLARKVRWLRLSGISLLASLGQALTAVVLVYAGVWVLNLTRERMVGVTEEILAPVSYAAIGLIGLWLVWRGVRRFIAPMSDWGASENDHDTGAVCGECGHRHGPTAEELARIGSLREVLGLIAGIAVRPCTGALFVLIITWQMQIPWIGVFGAVAMALGTASVTIGIGLAAIGFRGGLIRALSGSPVLSRAVPLVEISAGLLVALIATGLFLRAV